MTEWLRIIQDLAYWYVTTGRGALLGIGLWLLAWRWHIITIKLPKRLHG